MKLGVDGQTGASLTSLGQNISQNLNAIKPIRVRSKNQTQYQ